MLSESDLSRLRTTTDMSTAAAVLGSNLSTPCDQLDFAFNYSAPDVRRCLFSLLPYTDAVPALILALCALTITSLSVNALTLFGLRGADDESWERRFTLFRNLVLNDLLQTLVFAPSVIHALMQRRTVAFNAWCHVQYFVGSVLVFNSLLTITLMAVERYVFVCHAIHYLVLLTRARLWLALGLTWLFSLSVGIVNLLLVLLLPPLGTEQLQQQWADGASSGLICEPDMMEERMGYPRASALYRKVLGPAVLGACLLVNAFSYLRMYQAAKKAMLPIRAVNTAARKTVLFYQGMLLFQLLPLFVKLLSDAVWEVVPEGRGVDRAQHGATAAVLHVSLVVATLVPPCVNPLVFGMRNVEMRRALLAPLRRCSILWADWRSRDQE